MNVTGVRVRNTVISSSPDKHLYIDYVIVLCIMIVLDDVSDADAFLQWGVV